MAVNWDKYGFVSASSYRTKIVKSLSTSPKTPIQISIESKLYKTHVSTVLKELIDENIVECLTPNLRRGKIFSLTPNGKEIVKQILQTV